jgi:hypothetical protein
LMLALPLDIASFSGGVGAILSTSARHPPYY